MEWKRRFWRISWSSVTNAEDKKSLHLLPSTARWWPDSQLCQWSVKSRTFWSADLIWGGRLSAQQQPSPEPLSGSGDWLWFCLMGFGPGWVFPGEVWLVLEQNQTQDRGVYWTSGWNCINQRVMGTCLHRPDDVQVLLLSQERSAERSWACWAHFGATVSKRAALSAECGQLNQRVCNNIIFTCDSKWTVIKPAVILSPSLNFKSKIWNNTTHMK